MSLKDEIREILYGVFARPHRLSELVAVEEEAMKAIMEAIEKDEKGRQAPRLIEPEWPGRFNEDDWREDR